MFKDRVVLITGGSRGIGRACAQVLAEAGATVVVVGRTLETVRATADALNAAGHSAFAGTLDVSEYNAVKAVVNELVTKFEKIDVLVNNAGITKDNLLLRMKKEDWDVVIATNLNGAFNCTKEVLPHMLKRRYGRIINITSVVAQTGNPGQANYVAAKAGIIGFTKALAREVASRAITVNAVAPGFIDTEMTRALPEAAKQKLLESIPLGRMGSDMDVAYAVKFLASEEAGYITGHVLNINGGMYM
jgi:3-oxoacyl-[acyl-carrier protein] reductase